MRYHVESKIYCLLLDLDARQEPQVVTEKQNGYETLLSHTRFNR